MNRRRFLTMAAGLVGGIALEQAIPLGRVWSFPKEIKPLNIEPDVYVTGGYDLFLHGLQYHVIPHKFEYRGLDRGLQIYRPTYRPTPKVGDIVLSLNETPSEIAIDDLRPLGS